MKPLLLSNKDFAVTTPIIYHIVSNTGPPLYQSSKNKLTKYNHVNSEKTEFSFITFPILFNSQLSISKKLKTISQVSNSLSDKTKSF